MPWGIVVEIDKQEVLAQISGESVNGKQEIFGGGCFWLK